MESRERVLTALDGGMPDRVPRAFSFYHVDVDDLGPHWQGKEPVDVDFVNFPASPEERELALKARPYEPDTRLGNAGQVANYARWRYHPERAGQPNPLACAETLDDLRSFPFPDLSAPYRARGLALQVERLHARGLAAAGNPPHLGGELFEAAWRLRGLENFLLDLIERPDWAHFLLDRLTEMARRNAETLAAAGIDLLALDDDIGMPGTLMISPATWRTFFKPRLADIILSAQRVKPDLRVLYHSDGCFEPVIGDLMEIGVNAINPLQPEYMDAASIRKRFGPRLALWGTVGRQTTFSFAKPDEIRDEVRQRIDTLGRAGLILCPAYDIDEPDVPRENILAFLQAAEDFGRDGSP